MRRLKVCHLITLLELGGAQQNTLYTVGHLDRSRFEVALIAGDGGQLDGQAERIEGLHFETCGSLRRQLSPLHDLRALVDLQRRLKRLAPDIVHTHSSKAGVVGRLAAALAGVPVIVHTVHGWGFTPLQPALLRETLVLAERACSTLTTRLIAVSEANAELGAAERIAPREAFEIIRSGIELSRYREVAGDGALRSELGIDEATPLAGMIACLKPQKAPLDFVEVALRVGKLLPRAHFFLAGDGELRGEVERAIARAGLEDRFHLLGWRDDPERLLAAADLLVLTSRHEGLPRVIPEAMAAGRPVVVTAVDGSPEAVREGETGHLLEPGDVEGIAGRVAELLQDPLRREEMGRAASKIVPEWDIDEMVRRQERLYSELAGAAGLGTP